jgi:translation elongation factor EF-G
LARVFRGNLTVEMSIFALGKDFADNRESQQKIILREFVISHVRYLTPVEVANSGMIVKIDPLLKGITTLSDIPEAIFPQLRVPMPLLKLGVEPLDPSKNQQLLESIDKALLCYPSLQVQGEANGDRYLLGTGELMMDCVMYDIRNSFARTEVKVSDPFVVFNETVASRSVTICRTIIEDQNSIGIIAEPMRAETQYSIENSRLAVGPGLAEQLGRITAVAFRPLLTNSVISRNCISRLSILPVLYLISFAINLYSLQMYKAFHKLLALPPKITTRIHSIYE